MNIAKEPPPALSAGGNLEAGSARQAGGRGEPRGEGRERSSGSRVAPSPNQLLSLFDSMDEVVYVADPETYEMLYMNAPARKHWGNGIGRKCYQVLQNRDSPCPFCTNHRIFGERAGHAYIWEFQNTVNHRWYRCIDRAILLPDGRRVRFEMAIDITEKRRAKEALAARMKELEDFNRLAVDRELRMIELKKEVNRLLAERGLPPKYEIV